MEPTRCDAFDLAWNLREWAECLPALRKIRDLDARLARHVAPACSGWSALEHAAHVALANELIVRNLDTLLRGRGALLLDAGEPSAEALAVLTSGRIPRGRAQSPRMVRPPGRVDVELLDEWLLYGEQGVERFHVTLDALARASGRVPHQLLGPLSATLWVRFANVHTRHHLAIAAEVLACDPPNPRAVP